MAPAPSTSSKETTPPNPKTPSGKSSKDSSPQPIRRTIAYAQSGSIRDSCDARGVDNYGGEEDEGVCVIAGPANTYGHYVTTREEYSVQRYEGASTIFGPATLEAYINKYSELVPYLGDNATGIPTSNAAPPEQTSKAISLQTSVLVDNPPIFKHFGDVLADVESGIYHAGDTLAVRFVVLTLGLINGEWVAVRTDSHPSTTYQWNRTSKALGTSTVDIRWTIEDGTPVGTYRITYYGDSKSLFGSISAFTYVLTAALRIKVTQRYRLTKTRHGQ
ncbi:Neutral/alkaline non-lysosomal ceramidase-domain-containing protein [Suillus spraguei]|nr:Neutral/alkaline non-lysosomal ceramidase-domain-containing protein [Suillus spraguei]